MAYRDTGLVLPAEGIEYYVVLSRTSDIAPGPGGSRITPIDVGLVPVVSEAGGIGCDLYPSRVQFVALYPSAQLVAHCDPPITGTRYHIPLVVNDGCWSFSEGVWQQLAVGRVYQMDPTTVHGAVNWGAEMRLHLIVDAA